MRLHAKRRRLARHHMGRPQACGPRLVSRSLIFLRSSCLRLSPLDVERSALAGDTRTKSRRNWITRAEASFDQMWSSYSRNNLAGETEAGSAGTQPWRGIDRWAKDRNGGSITARSGFVQPSFREHGFTCLKSMLIASVLKIQYVLRVQTTPKYKICTTKAHCASKSLNSKSGSRHGFEPCEPDKILKSRNLLILQSR